MAHGITPFQFEQSNHRPELRIFTLGRFLVARDAQSISIAPGQGKPFDLLRYLVCQPHGEAIEERVVDALWPDAEAGDPAKTLAITLHRLRKIVGSDAIVLKNKKLRLNREVCWIDAWAFEEILKHAGNGAGAGADVGFGELEFALDLYQGDFLAGEPEDFWLLAPRERIKGKYLAHLARLADVLIDAGQCAKAGDYLMRGLNIDPTAEVLYQKLMTCHHRHGYPSEVVKTYHQCRRLLACHLEVEPSERTLRLYRTLTGEMYKARAVGNR